MLRWRGGAAVAATWRAAIIPACGMILTETIVQLCAAAVYYPGLWHDFDGNYCAALCGCSLYSQRTGFAAVAVAVVRGPLERRALPVQSAEGRRGRPPLARRALLRASALGSHGP